MTNDSNYPVPPQTSRAQRGVALVVSMMMLVAITLIGVAVMNSSRLEWLMAANSAFQTSAYTQAEAALRAGERAIIQNTCDAVGGTPTGQQASPDSNNCRPVNFSWQFADQFYNTSIDPTTVPDSLPAGTNLRAANTWANGFGTPAAGGRYAVIYRGCSLNDPLGTTPPNLCANPPIGNQVMSLFTYEVWAYSSDAKGAARIVQSTYVMLVNWSNNNWPLGNDAPLPAGSCFPPLGANPCPGRNAFTQFRRVGYVEIN